MLAEKRVDLLLRACAAVQTVDPELAGRLRATFDLPMPAALPGLTTREGQIATLAAAGLSNLEISRRLVISIRTVECHLARVYHKLGVTSRRELPEFVYAAA
jgi:DNA-binding NarL/FixJ family response regulator